MENTSFSAYGTFNSNPGERILTTFYRLLAAAVNSLYSFWWDVTHDWGLDLLRPRAVPSNTTTRSRSPPKRLVLPHLHSRSTLAGHRAPMDEDIDKSTMIDASKHNHARYPWGLRPSLLFPLPVYPFAVLADLILRLTWSAKLSSHLHSYSEGDLIIFWIELAEILRRWMWVFLRVEWEVVKHEHFHDGGSHPGSTILTPRDGLFSTTSSGENYEMLPPNRDENIATHHYDRS